MDKDEMYMRMAIDQAKQAEMHGEVPIGAVVVYTPIDKATRRPLDDPRVVASAHNLRETLKSPSAHAEFLAIQQACEELERWRLTDCCVYVTLEPCMMCAGLMQQARISRCVFGAHDPKAGALDSLYAVGSDERLNHRFDIKSGVCEEECAAVLRDFFQKRRK